MADTASYLNSIFLPSSFIKDPRVLGFWVFFFLVLGGVLVWFGGVVCLLGFFLGMTRYPADRLFVRLPDRLSSTCKYKY